MNRNRLSLLIAASILLIGAAAYAANELSLVLNWSYSKAGVTLNNNNTQLITISGTAANSDVVNVSTNDTELTLGSVTSPGWIFLKNLSAAGTANYIRVGADGTNYLAQINAQEAAVFRLNASTLHAICQTNSTSLFYILLSQ